MWQCFVQKMKTPKKVRKGPVPGEKLAVQRMWRETSMFWPMVSYTKTWWEVSYNPDGSLHLPSWFESTHCPASNEKVIINLYSERIWLLPPLNLYGTRRSRTSRLASTPISRSSSTNFPPTPQHPLFTLGVRWRLQNCTITGLSHTTKDTMQLPQAFKYFVNVVSFLSKCTAFLLSPAPRSHPPVQSITSMQCHSQAPGAQQQAPKIRLQLPAVATLDKGLLGKGGVGSKAVAMVNMPPNKQQRKKEPKSLSCSPRQNPHRLWKKSSTSSSDC